jgi:hypothetical protein
MDARMRMDADELGRTPEMEDRYGPVVSTPIVRWDDGARQYRAPHPALDGEWVWGDTYTDCLGAWATAARVANRHAAQNEESTCNCVLPSQSCSECREAARALYDEVF